MIDFQKWQAISIQAFGFISTLIFCIEGIARIGAAAWGVIKKMMKGEE